MLHMSNSCTFFKINNTETTHWGKKICRHLFSEIKQKSANTVRHFQLWSIQINLFQECCGILKDPFHNSSDLPYLFVYFVVTDIRFWKIPETREITL